VQNLRIVQGDALTVGKLGCTKIVSSPPYNISSKLVLFIVKNRFELAVLLLQHEFVQRLIAKSGSREYGRITVMLQAVARTETIGKVPRSAFYPSPKVDSALVTIKPRTDPLQIRDPSLFEDLVRSLFSQRRRKVKTVLTKYLESRNSHRFSSMLLQLDVPEKRVFQMTPTELVDLANQIAYTLEEE
jgi:16S rRNA (adenine1518-N6/adenine1519-N6)-dimethyltransferase